MKTLPEIFVDWDGIQNAVCCSAECEDLDCNQCKIHEIKDFVKWLAKQAEAK